MRWGIIEMLFNYGTLYFYLAFVNLLCRDVYNFSKVPLAAKLDDCLV